MALNIVHSYNRSTSTPSPQQHFFNVQKPPVQPMDGVRVVNVHQMQAVSFVPDPNPKSPKAIATDPLNHSGAGFFTSCKSTEEANSDGSLPTEVAALLGNANVDGGSKQESCTEDASTKPKNSQPNSADLFPDCEQSTRLSSADSETERNSEPERNLREPLAGGQQDLRIEKNTLRNAAHVPLQKQPPSGPSLACDRKQLYIILAAVICYVILLTAFVLGLLILSYLAGRQSVHPSNAVVVTCHCANVSATLEV